jgi:DNA invertase Pin-like site-specific DNA recombinase
VAKDLRFLLQKKFLSAIDMNVAKKQREEKRRRIKKGLKNKERKRKMHYKSKVEITIESKKPLAHEAINVILYAINTQVDEVNSKISRKENRMNIAQMSINMNQAEGSKLNGAEPSRIDTEDS